MENAQTNSIDFTVDKKNLYREEMYTDLKVASIRRLIPVKSDGKIDKSRDTIYVGQTHLMSPDGPVPLQNVIQAKGLQQAIKKFPDAMQTAMDQLVEKAQKMKDKEESRIIVPGR
jgi:hypothetical protein